jgi:hypothetical protein
MADAERTETRRLAVLVRELAEAGRYESLADLTADLKGRCARLKLPWTNDTISAAYRLVGSNRPLRKGDRC